jgi:hypothetical protein
MLALALLLAVAPTAVPTAKPTPAPTARPAPALGRAGEPARAKSLSEHAAEMKTKGTPARRVSFDDVRSVEADELEPAAPEEKGRAGAAPGAGEEKSAASAAAQAQKRMDRAVERGLATPDRSSTARRDRARREWDDAAEACRRTPGCVPLYRDDPRYGDDKPLKTDQELIDDVRKRGFSEPHPPPK